MIAFGLNEGGGSGPGNGSWHFIASQTEPQVGEWYHIAAECGSQGMKLFVNGHLEASDPYAGGPQPDWSDGTLAGGWFSIGDNDSHEPGYLTLRSSYKELRVSDYQRYDDDFVPLDPTTSDAHAVLLDHLIGGTSGQNHGMVWVP